jgi:peroxisomal membrane protein 2
MYYNLTPCSDDILQLFGFAYGGPFGHFLHKILDYIFQGKKDTKTIAKKVYLFHWQFGPQRSLLSMHGMHK